MQNGLICIAMHASRRNWNFRILSCVCFETSEKYANCRHVDETGVLHDGTNIM